MNELKTAVIGSGPAGLTAAIYLSRANLSPTLFAGVQYGGQLMYTTLVENFPGFPDGVMGPELMERMIQQAKNLGTNVIYENVIKIESRNRPFKIFADSGEYNFDGIIISTGASAKWLGLESERKFIGRGVSSCATCDGAFYKEKIVAVVGGGDTAMEDSLFLTRFAKKVYIIHRKDTFKASKIMAEKAIKNNIIEVLYNTEVIDVLGDTNVKGIKVKNNQTNELKEIQIDGLFVAIGQNPNSSIFQNKIDIDTQGFIKTYENTRTNIEGVYCAGDVHDSIYKQAITAAAEGCKAAMDLERYFSQK